MIEAESIKYNLQNLPQLVLEVTDACNLRCEYCGYASLYEGYDKREDRFMSFDMAKAILDYLFDIWKANYSVGVIRPVTIGFYGGEPLLNMDLIRQVVDYTEQQGCTGKKFVFNMTTNAMLLDRYADYLVEHEFRLLISLDGDKKGHSYRVDHQNNNSFERVFKNVKSLQAKYPTYFDKYVMFNSVLHNRNNVESIYKFIKSTFKKEASITQLTTTGINPNKRDEFLNIFRNYSESLMAANDCEALQEELFLQNPMTKAILDFIHNESGNVYSSYNHLLTTPAHVIENYTGTCMPFSKKLFVTVNGKILPCEKINQKYYLGTVDNNIDLDLQSVANMYNCIVQTYKDQCELCGYRGKCRKCIYQDDGITSKKTVCSDCTSINDITTSKLQALKYLRSHPELYYKLITNAVVK